MNITFLIGNGFDLNCGLKSSYNDMYEGYCEEKETDSEVIKKFKKLIKQEQEKNNYKNWSDFEWAMREHINAFKTEDDFVECLRDFKKYLITYLSEEKRKFLEKYDNNSIKVKVYEEILNSISDFYKDITNNITNIINRQKAFSNNLNYTFISFNYTCMLDEIFKHFSSPLKKYKSNFINIHGSLDDNDIVLGIDNENQLNLKNFKFSNKGKFAFVKPFFNEKYDNNRFVKANNAIWESDIICVYGMSLGESDLTWKNLIIKWLDSVLSEDNKYLFVYDYKNFEKNIKFKDELIYEEECAKKNFIIEKLNIKETNDKFEKYCEKIYMPFKNIFNINEIVNKKEIMLKTAYQKMIDGINKK